MDRHRRPDVVARRGNVNAPPRGRHVDADLHDPVDADGVRRRHGVRDCDVHQIQMAMTVECDGAERWWGWWRFTTAAGVPAHGPLMRPSSSSITDGSSLANNGVGA